MTSKSLIAALALASALAASAVMAATTLPPKPTMPTAQQMFPDPQVALLADAAAQGRVAEVNRLLDAGVNVNATGAQGMTALGYAIINRNLQGMEALLKRGADPNFAVEDPVLSKPLPFILILTQSDAAKLIDMLLRYGADPNTRMPPRAKSDDSGRYDGDSLLSKSVMDFEAVKTIVEHGADVNYVPHPNAASTGHKPAASSAAALGQFDVVAYLIDHGAMDLDDIADILQGRPWSEDFRPARLVLLEKIRSKGGRIYRAYKPSRSPDVENYTPQDTPEAWLTEGYYDVAQTRREHLARWQEQESRRSSTTKQ